MFLRLVVPIKEIVKTSEEVASCPPLQAAIHTRKRPSTLSCTISASISPALATKSRGIVKDVEDIAGDVIPGLEIPVTTPLVYGLAAGREVWVSLV